MIELIPLCVHSGVVEEKFCLDWAKVVKQQEMGSLEKFLKSAVRVDAREVKVASQGTVHVTDLGSREKLQ